MQDRYAETTYSNGYEFTAGSGYRLPEYAFVAPPEVASGEIGHEHIVIVGGGITGLTLACALARLGVRAVLLDEDNTVGVKGASSRGICYTQKSLEIFDRLGIYPRIAAKGVQWSVGRTFAGQDEVYSFDLRQQSAYHLSSQPPFINIQQFYIEGYLVERIHELGDVELRWNNRVIDFEQDAQAATLTIQTPAGPYRLRADHVIDATGSRSPFHAWVGAQLTAKKGDDRWCIADVRFATRPPGERHTWIEAPFNDNRAVWQHLMADDVWRIDYQMAPDADPAYVSREDVVRERLARQFGADTEVDIVWVGPYAYRSECIDQMRHGRVFFIGDAATVVSPFGARGGNTGNADADNLAWKLAAVVQGRAGEALLDSYSSERVQAFHLNAESAMRSTEFMSPPSRGFELLREAALSLAGDHPVIASLLNPRQTAALTYTDSPLSGAQDALAAGPVAGAPLTDRQLADGSHLTDHLHRAGFTLFGFGAARTRVQALVAGAGDDGGLALAAVAVDDVDAASAHGADPGAVYLVRPDGHVAARWRDPTASQVQTALRLACAR